MSSTRSFAAGVAGLALTGTGLAVATAPGAVANPAGTGLVISEVYGGGGNSGATYTHDFIELYNPTTSPIPVDGMSVQYRSASGSGTGFTNLTGSVAPGRHYLVREAAGAGGTTALPAPDATGGLAMSATDGSVALVTGTGTVPPTATNTVDLVGYGGATLREGSAAPRLSNTTAATRDDLRSDSDSNATDFSTASPDPQNSASVWPPEITVVDATIAQVQGTGSRSPYAGRTYTHVRTRGVVTAAYPAGGFYSFVIQTEGTGGGADATPGASDGLWVHQVRDGVDAEVGDFVEVTGRVEERFGRTELSYDPADGALTQLDQPFAPVAPRAGAYPTTSGAREAHESELLDVAAQEFTVTNNYATNEYAEIGLATGSRPLVAPTEVADAQDEAAVEAVADDNFARGVVLDDGADWNYFDVDFYRDKPLPWLSRTNTVRVGSTATFTGPVVLDYGFGDWRFQPTHQVTDEGRDVATFTDTRHENLAPQPVGGDLKLATFNVLNYFNTTGEDYVAAGGSCTYYRDRDDDPVTNNTCSPNGPRGAAEEEDFLRQQAKIVRAINTMDADIMSLEEIENSVALGEHSRDDALRALVKALNTDAGATRWAAVPSPPASQLPPVEGQDVIRTAFIFNPATVDLVGGSKVLVGSTAFANAREPLAQSFAPEGAGRAGAFNVIVNHFKSKGSGVDDETGQGNANPDRVAQAEALVDFAESFQADRGIGRTFLTGDFNSYSMEDPIQVLEAAGYTNLQSDTPDEWTYSFDGMSGSLDHVLANDAALGDVTGVDIWNINAVEAVAYEYSRHNHNVTDFYSDDVFRSSDHDPEVVGLDVS